MIRSIGAVVLAFVAWFVVATIGNLALRGMIAGYAAAEATMTFTLPMQIGRLAVGLVSSLCAGAVCAAIAGRRRLPVKIFAGIMLLLFIPEHYVLRAKFPIWYHAFFLITLAPAVLLGASCWRRLAKVAGRANSS
jgi:hypothetical protein